MTNGIEDGMGDEQAVRQMVPTAHWSNHGMAGMTRIVDGDGTFLGWNWADARAKLPAAVPEAKPEPPATDRRKTMKLCIEFEPTDTRIMEFVRSLVPEGERLEFHEVCNDKAPIDEDAYIAMFNKLHALRVLVGRLPNHSKECESMTFRDPTKCDCVYGEIAKAIRE